MKCYYCNTDIRKGLPFCSKCHEPLLSCPECGRYFSPLANFCSRCSTFLGELNVPEHGPSNSLKLSDLLGTDTTPSVNVQTKHLGGPDVGRFNIEPLIALGCMFVVSQSGRIWVLNLHTLKKYDVGLTQIPLTEVKSNPILVRQIVQLEDGRKLRKNFLCVASDEKMFLLSIEHRSRSSPIVLHNLRKWRLDGQCRTDPLYLKDSIIIGTDQKLLAYDIDGAKLWEYDCNGSLSHENIATPLSTDGDRIFFGSHKGNTGHIHCVQAHNGSLAWDEPYTIQASGIGNIHIVSESERLILCDRDGTLYNLSANGKDHFSPIGGKISDRPAAVGRCGDHLYVATSLGNIHCLDSLGDMVKPRYEPGRQFFFHSRPAVGSDFILFVAHDGSLFFVETTHDSGGRLKVRTVSGYTSLQVGVIAAPILSDKYLYLLSGSGHLVRVEGNKK